MDVPLIDEIRPTYRLAVDETGAVQTAPDGCIIVVDSETSAMFRLPSCQQVWQHFGISEETQQDNSAERRTRKAARWTHQDTLKLIDEWRSRRERFENNIDRNEALWEEVSTSLGHNYTALRCENRFKYLKRLYLETKDKNNNSTGAPEQTCPYYEEFDEMFRYTPQVNPPSLTSSRDPPNYSGINQGPPPGIEPIPDTDNIFEHSSHSVRTQRRRGHRRTRHSLELSDLIEEMRNEARVREETRERRHQEIIELQRETNSLYKDLMTKLIEKL